MKKIALLVLIALLPLFLGGCFLSAKANKVLDYDFNAITSIQIFSVQTSSGVTLEKEDAEAFYHAAKQLNFVMNYSFDEEEGLPYEYYFVVRYKTLFFQKIEMFVLNENLFYNQYNKRTLGTDQPFVLSVKQMFNRLWQQKISEV